MRTASRWRERAQVAALAACAAAIYFVSLGKTALLDWDEALYAEISKESLRTHVWLTPLWAYRPFFEKPPLTFWFRTAFFRFFGISEFWARAESALSGIVIVLLTFAIVRRTSSERAALFAGLPHDASVLAELVQGRPSTETILEGDVMPQLSGSYRIRPLAQDGDLMYALISPLP